MTFKELQDAVLADAFGEPRRLSVRHAINHRYQLAWDAEEWTFKVASQAVTVNTGSNLLAGLPATLGNVLTILDQYGEPLDAIGDIALFLDEYGDTTLTGQPEAFTADAGVIRLGPVPNITSTAFTLVHEKQLEALLADTDTPLLPTGYHRMLVHGARADEWKLLGVPLWQPEEEQWERALDGMRRAYLAPIRGDAEQWGAYRPEAAW